MRQVLRWVVASGAGLVAFAITWSIGQGVFKLDTQSAIGVATVVTGAVATPLLWWAGQPAAGVRPTVPQGAPVTGRPAAALDGAAGVRTIGLPVAYGLELFKNRGRELALIGQRLADPATRIVIVTGRRGIGKSAVAAKVMEGLARGEWPGGITAPAPAGLVNLSTRTAGISVERIYLDCAHLLGDEREAALHAEWARTDRSTRDKIGKLLDALGDRLFVILLDNLEDLQTDDGRLDDDELSTFLDCVFRAQATPRLLITSQVQLRLAPELRRFAAHVELASGLPPEDAVTLLRELDRDGTLGVGELSDEQLLHAAVRVHGVPRALELLVGVIADDSVALPTLQEVLEDFTMRADVVADLAQDRYRRLDTDARALLGVLGALRTPATLETVTWLLAGLTPHLDVTAVLAHLVRVRMVAVDRSGRTFALQPMDADLTYADLPPDGPLGRPAVNRRIADWYRHTAQPRDTWRTPDDTQPLRREFDHRVRAGDYDDAALVLATMSDWLVWHGAVLAAVSMHLAIDGHLDDDHARLAHLIGFGHARLHGGPMTHAVDLFTAAADLAERLNQQAELEDALFGLGDAHRQLGHLDDAVTWLTRAVDLARRLDDTGSEIHALLSLSLAHSYLGDGTTALAGADRLAELARLRNDRLTHARAWNARSIALLTLGRWTDAIEAGRNAAAAYRVAGSMEAVTYALNVQGIALIALDRGDEALAVLDAARDDASTMENVRAEGICLYNMAWACWTAGRFPEAAATAERATVSLRIAGATEQAAAHALAEAANARVAGDLDNAAAALRRAAELTRHNAEVVRPAWLLDEAERGHRARPLQR